MNERIKELLLQAEIKFDRDINEIDVCVLLPSDLEKFAQLIVLECANAVMDGTKEGDHYAMRIENHFDSGTGGVLHFGVEE